MLTFSFQLRVKNVLIAIRMGTKICRLGEGHNLCPLECQLSVGKPNPKTMKMLLTKNEVYMILFSLETDLLNLKEEEYTKLNFLD